MRLSQHYNQIPVLLKIIFTVAFISFLLNFNLAYSLNSSNSQISNNKKEAYIQNYSSYVDLNKNVVIIGSVAKSDNQSLPIEVTLGVNAYNNLSKRFETITEHPFDNPLYKKDSSVPFKFVLNSSTYSLKTDSVPFIYSLKSVKLPYIKYNTFKLSYPVQPQGPLKQLLGNVTNDGLDTINNLTLYASVHDKKGAQIDSVRTLIPTVKSHETVNFTFSPNPAIKDNVYYYSCVGGDLKNLSTDQYENIHVTPSKTLGYKFTGLMEVNSVHYDKNTHQFDLKLNNMYPSLGSLSFKLIPGQKSPVSVLMDGVASTSAIVKNDSNSTSLELSIPQGNHEILLSGIE